MAHVREERRLHVRCLDCLIARHRHLGNRPVALGDVVAERHPVLLTVKDHIVARHLDLDDRAVLASDAVRLGGDRADPSAPVPRPSIGPHLGVIVRGQQVRDRHRQQLLTRVAVARNRRVAGSDNPQAVPFIYPHGQRVVVKEQPIAFLAGPQRLYARRDVARHDAEAGRSAGLDQPRDRQRHLEPRAVFAQPLRVEVGHGIPAGHAPHEPFALREPVGRVEHDRGAPNHLRFGIAVERLGSPVPRRDQAVQVRAHDRLVGGIDEGSQAPLARSRGIMLGRCPVQPVGESKDYQRNDDRPRDCEYRSAGRRGVQAVALASELDPAEDRKKHDHHRQQPPSHHASRPLAGEYASENSASVSGGNSHAQRQQRPPRSAARSA